MARIKALLSVTACYLIVASMSVSASVIIVEEVPDPRRGFKGFVLHAVSAEDVDQTTSIELGSSVTPPILVPTDSPNELLVMRHSDDNAEWRVDRFNIESGSLAKVIAPVPGSSMRAPPFLASGGRYLVTLLETKGSGTRLIATDLIQNEVAHSIELDGNLFSVSIIGDDHLLVSTDARGKGGQPIQLLSLEKREVVWSTSLPRKVKPAIAHTDTHVLIFTSDRAFKRVKPSAANKISKARGWETQLSLVNVSTGSQTPFQAVGVDVSQLFRDPESGALVFASNKDLDRSELWIWSVDRNSIGKITSVETSCIPESLIASNSINTAMVACESGLVRVDLDSQKTVASYIATPVTPQRMQFSADGSAVYAGAAERDKIYRYSLDPLELSGSRSTATARSRLTTVAANVAGVGLLAATGTGFISVPNQKQPGLIQHPDSKVLYALNPNAQYLWRFDAQSLKPIDGVNVEISAIYLTRFEGLSPLIAVGHRSFAFIDPESMSVTFKRKDSTFLIDKDSEGVFYGENSTLQWTDLETLETRDLLSELQVIQQIVRTGVTTPH